MSEEKIWQLVVLIGAPVVAAVIAAVSAVIRRAWERRDTSRRSQQMIEQATKQTEFVNSWLSAHEKLGGEAAVSAQSALAERTLEQAYGSATVAALRNRDERHDGRSWVEILVQQLQAVLLLGESARSHVVIVGTFYVLVAFSWIGVFEGESESDPDYTALSDDLAFAIIGTLLLRIVFGLLIAWRERRKSDGDEAPPAAAPAVAPVPDAARVPSAPQPAAPQPPAPPPSG